MAMGDNEQLKDIVTVALHTGMRRGEIFNLKWFDLDFDRGIIQVRKTRTKLNRVVPMNARVKEVLNQQRRPTGFVLTSEKTGCSAHNSPPTDSGRFHTNAADSGLIVEIELPMS